MLTLDIIDEKIEVPKPWRNKKRVKMKQQNSRVILGFEEENFENSLLKKELDKGISSLKKGKGIIASSDFFQTIRKNVKARFSNESK